MLYGPLGPLLFPLLVLVVPLGGEALHGVDSHVQHPLELLCFVLRIKCVWDVSVYYKKTIPNVSIDELNALICNFVLKG